MYLFLLEEIMKEKAVDIEDLAKETGLSIDYLQDLKNNVFSDTNVSKIYKIAKALEVSMEDLMYPIDQYEALKKELESLTKEQRGDTMKVVKMQSILKKLEEIRYES